MSIIKMNFLIFFQKLNISDMRCNVNDVNKFYKYVGEIDLFNTLSSDIINLINS